jgi:hypothetical protein
MALALQVVKVRHSRRGKSIVYKVVPSGNYPANGDTIDLTAATNPNSIADANWEGNPQYGYVLNGWAGNDAELVPGATLATWKIKQYSAANTEFGNGSAYNAALTGNPNLLIELYGNTGGGQYN